MKRERLTVGVAAVAVSAFCLLAAGAAASVPYRLRGTRGKAPAHHRDGKRAVPVERSPFSPGLRSWLAARADGVDAAVLDLRTGKEFYYHPGLQEQTASIVKVDILETLLHETQSSGGLSPSQYGIAQGMIEDSDNDDATDLWDDEGAAPAVAAYNRLAGLTDTDPNGAWGLTETTAPDQIALLEQLVEPPARLTRASQNYALYLMSHVESDEAWGISGGVPSGVQIAIKNGWLPFGDGWHVNSIGRVKGDGRHYLIAVLTDDNSTEQYGIDTIQYIAGAVWKDLAPVGNR